MKRVVYVITSTGEDIYAVMTRISIASLRISNMNMTITIACDTETNLKIQHAGSELLNEVDDWIVVDTPSGEAEFRNRFVKTSLRQHIEGPFVFLDSDILIRGDISSIFLINSDIAAARNHSKKLLRDQIWAQDAEILALMKWDVGEEYLNGGVIFFNDTSMAEKLSEIWHELWLNSYGNNGSTRDQPALNMALASIKLDLHVLSDVFNAQIKNNIRVSKGASVWHYYTSGDISPITEFEKYTSDVLNGRAVEMKDVVSMVFREHPWRRGSILDDWLARRVHRRGKITKWEREWMSGQRKVSIMHVLNELPVRIIKQ